MLDAVDRLRHGRMGIAALVVGGGILASRLLGIVREMVFAALLGASGTTDEYVAAFRIPDYANYLLAGGFLTITFIPIFSRHLAEGDAEGGWAAFTAIVRWLAVAIVTVIAVGWLAAPWVIDALYPRFTPAQVAETVRLTRIVLPAQFAFVVGAMFVAVQYATGRFAVPSLAPVVYNLGIIAGGIGHTLVTGRPDPEGFVWGALAGAFVGNLGLQIWGARSAGLRLVPGTPWRHPAMRTYLTIAFPLMIGQSVVAFDETFMSVFGGLVGEAAQTHLLYARRTMLVPVGLIAQAAAVAAYPFLARLHAEGRSEELFRSVDRALRWVLAASFAATGLLTALSLPVVRVLYERGNFTVADSVAVADALFFYAFAVPVWGTLQVLTRGFYAQRRMWAPVVVGTVGTVVAVPVYWWGATTFGTPGVAVASVASLALYTTVLGATWYRDPRARAGLRAVVEVAKRAVPPTVLGAIAAAVVASAALRLAPGWTTLTNLLATVLGVGAFAATALGVGALLHDLLGRGGARRTDGLRDVTGGDDQLGG